MYASISKKFLKGGFPWVCPISATASFLDWAAPRNEATNGMFLKQESSLSCLFPGLQWCCPKVQKQGLHTESLHLHHHNQKQSCPTTKNLGARVNWKTLFECLTAYCIVLRPLKRNILLPNCLGMRLTIDVSRAQNQTQFRGEDIFNRTVQWTTKHTNTELQTVPPAPVLLV